MELTRRLSPVTGIPDIAAKTVQRILAVKWVRQAAMSVVRTTAGQMSLVHRVEYRRLLATLDRSPESGDTL